MRQFCLPQEMGGAPVRIEAGGLHRIGSQLVAEGFSGRAFMVADENTHRRFGSTVAQSCADAGISLLSAVVAPGEASKSLATSSILYDQLAQANWHRDEPIVALGGGMVTDLAGFVAATWLRGIPLVSCPTSLQGAVDAAIGGKCGINHPAGKNLIGAFHHPRLVLIDPTCFESLPERTFRAGLAESVKHALIADESFLTWQEQRYDDILGLHGPTIEELVERNIRIKIGFVQGDTRDTLGSRIKLNFGHTVGHAIETHLGFELLHGECVALGMVAAAWMSTRLGLLSEASHQRLSSALRRFELPTTLADPLDVDAVLALIEYDKKVRAGRRRFVLLDEIGHSVVHDNVPDDLVRDSVSRLTAR